MFSSGKLQPRIASKLLVSLLMSAHAPPEVMAKYLKLITDSEEKLKLANACNCYSAAIDVRGDGSLAKVAAESGPAHIFSSLSTRR